MKQLTILLVILFASKDSYSQETVASQLEKRNYFFLSPLPLVDIANPALVVGYERLLREKLSIQVEGGPILKRSALGYLFTGLGFGTEGSWWTNKGNKLRTEIKLYTKNSFVLEGGRSYFALELFSTRNTSNVSRTFQVDDVSFDYSDKNVIFFQNLIYDDFYTIERSRYGANLKIGVKELKQDGIRVDISMGVGAVIHNLTEVNRANFNDQPLYPNTPFLKAGKRLLPSLTLGIKLGIHK